MSINNELKKKLKKQRAELTAALLGISIMSTGCSNVVMSSKPETKEHTHSYIDWESKNVFLEQSLCSCGAVGTQLHQYQLIIKKEKDSIREFSLQCLSCGKIINLKKELVEMKENIIETERQRQSKTKEETFAIDQYKETPIPNKHIPLETIPETEKKPESEKETEPAPVPKPEEPTETEKVTEPETIPETEPVTESEKQTESEPVPETETEKHTEPGTEKPIETEKQPESETQKPTESEPHTHQYTEYRGSTAEHEIWACPTDGEETYKNHALKEGYYDPASNNMIYECGNAGCDYKNEVPHTDHNYTFLSATSDLETLICSICSNTTTRGHNFSEGTHSPGSCNVVYNCLNDGCSETKTEVIHSYQEGRSVSYNGANPDYCYYIPYTCSVCGDSYNINKEHQLVTNSNPFGTEISCSNCSYSQLLPPSEEISLTRKLENKRKE